MNTIELKHQVKDLNSILLECIDHSPNLVESIIKLVKVHGHIKRKLNNEIYLREIKKRKLTNEYIKTFNTFDIKEALEIDKEEAKKKLKKSDFTIREKNIILNKYKGGVERFLEEYKVKLK